MRWNNVGAGYAVNLARGQKEAGHDVLFLGKDDLPPVYMAGKAGIATDNTISFDATTITDDLRRFKAIVAEFKPDVVNAHRPQGMNIAVAANYLSWKKRFIVVRSRVDIRPTRRNVFNRLLYRFVDGVIVPWGEGRDRHIALGMPPDRVATLPGGVDTTIFRPDVDGSSIRREFDIPADCMVAGLVARLDFVKGQDDFIRAAGTVAKKFPTARFLVIGEEINVKIADLKEIAAHEGVAERVIFIGHRPDVQNVVAALDVGVVASTGSEALSRVALEYMAAGKPVVATYVGGLPYIIEPDVNGVLVPPKNHEQMAAALIDLFSDKEKRDNLAAEGLKRVQNEYSIPMLVKNTIAFYEKIMKLRLRRK